ncbi:hypothetical protein TKK_0010031 [Trichogramma kaykai]
MDSSEIPSDDDRSTDKEEVLREFDKEAQLIASSETLPKKSADRYTQIYQQYKTWENENKSKLSTSMENNLVVYFKSLKDKVKPSTLWSMWVINQCKSKVFKWEAVKKFMNEANDEKYLSSKVILIFGLCGALRCNKLVQLKLIHIEDLKTRYERVQHKSATPRDYGIYGLKCLV